MYSDVRYGEEKQDKIMILYPDDNSYIANKIRERVKSTYSIYRRVPEHLRILRKIQMVMKLPLESIWYGDWKKKITDIDTVIVFDSVYSNKLIKWILLKKPSIRIIFWFWNPVINVELMNSLKALDCELWTFDLKDSKKYNMRFNNQFYFKDIERVQKEQKYDVIFVGKDKDRLNKINELELIFNKLKLTTFFHVVPDSNRFIREKVNAIPYSILIDKTMNSRAVLDLVQEGQSGLTLRVMEGIFLNKKIITNNKAIQEFDFYRKENVFIIGVDDLSKIDKFINLPYKKIPKNIKLEYDFNSWLNRFEIDKI